VVGVPSLTEETPYRISLVRTGEGPDASWLAEVEGLPGCSARAPTPEEAVQRAWAAAEESVSAGEAPKQRTPRHSGKLLVRMPATLHDELARAAESEGVSLNQLITGVLASAVEWRSSEGGVRRSEESAVAGGEETASARLTRVAIAANLAVVLVVAVVAIVLLVLAWREGF